MTPAFLFLLLAWPIDPPVPSPAPSPTPEPTVESSVAQPAAAGVSTAVAYPLGPLATPDFLAPGRPFGLADLRYGFSDEAGTTQTFAARVRFRDWGYLGTEVDGERRGLTLMTHRASVSAFAENGSWDLGGQFRARRFVLSMGAQRRAAPGGSWRLEPSLAFRILPGLEVEGWAVADTDRPGRRTWTGAGGDAFWQLGSRLEVLAGSSRSYELPGTHAPATGQLDENRIDRGLVAAVAQVGHLELTGQASIDDVAGRFPRRESTTSLAVRVPLLRRLLAEGSARNHFDYRSGDLDHEYRGALTWCARPVTLPRAGRAAEHVLALARHAARTGEYEFGVFDRDAIREQRERLSLSRQRETFRDELAALYRDEVAERLVPLLGLEFRTFPNTFTGDAARALHAFVGVPWPPAWPWRTGEGSVPFLQLDYEHQWHTTATEIHSGVDALSLTISLNREMDLVARWSRAEPTALDVLRGLGPHRRFGVSYVYARGR